MAPTCGGPIICDDRHVCFHEVHFLGQDVLLCYVASQIKVRISDGAGGVLERAQVIPYVLWKRFAP